MERICCKPKLEMIAPQIWQSHKHNWKRKKKLALHVLLTHHENVAWQTVEECIWHLWRLVWVALRSMPRIVVDRLGHQDATFDHFQCRFCDGHAVVTSNADVAAIEPASGVVLYALTLGTHSCGLAMNACRCARYDLE